MKKMASTKKSAIGKAGLLTAISAVALLGVATAGYCDDAYSMAPPVSGQQDAQPVADGSNSAASSVFNWQEVPENQRVVINRAVFDHGGYQLYDNVGETIIVPFKNDNLYVMKFAVSDSDQMYFINSGSAPVLYVPENGYLENATVDGAKWYPFTEHFHPADPVFLGCAPSWDDYVSIGWYPGMCCYGGYYSPYAFGIGVFEPSFGLFIAFGGHHFDGWFGYRNFLFYNPAPYRIGFYHPEFYGFAGRGYWGGREFNGGWGHYAGRGFAGEHSYAYNHLSNGSGIRTAHTFQGAGTRSFYSSHNYQSGNRSFGGEVGRNYNSGNSGHVFRGAVGGGSSFSNHYNTFGSRGFSGGDRQTGSFSSHSFSGGDRSFGTFNSHTTQYDAHSFQGGSGGFGGGSSSHSFSGGFGGGSSSHSFSGGGFHGGGSTSHSFSSGGSFHGGESHGGGGQFGHH